MSTQKKGISSELIAQKYFNIGSVSSQILTILFLYLTSALSLSLMLGRWRTFAEHVEINFDDYNKELILRHKIEGINTKKSFLSNILMHDANFNIHLMHHRFPNFPSSKLVDIKKKNSFINNSKDNNYFEEQNTLGKIKQVLLI